MFNDFERFLHPWREQSNTGNDKSERVLMLFCRSVDGVRFWALHDGNLCFFMLISRWFVMHFGVLLYDFELPSGSLISIYEWSSKQLKTRNFHHFLKRFLRWKNHVIGDVWWISWKIRIKFGRKKWSILWSFVHRYRVFRCFYATSKKTWYLWRFGSTVNIIFDFGSTQKCAKSDASRSVDAFDGVRDGDRIRASGDVLFFHIVK